MFTFLRLTLSADGTPVDVNVSRIVYIRVPAVQVGEPATLISTDMEALWVRESPDEIQRIISLAQVSIESQ